MALVVLRTNSTLMLLQAVRLGIGIGSLPCILARPDPDLERVPAGAPVELDEVWRTPPRSCLVAIMSLPTPRKGYRSVTPRMVVADAAAEVEFLRTVFSAVGEYQADRPTEMRIGDCLVMVTAAGAREVFPAFLYVYVDDADATYRRALSAGAVSLEPPLDTPYGDRRAMVRDPFGNVWQIAHVTAAS